MLISQTHKQQKRKPEHKNHTRKQLQNCFLIKVDCSLDFRDVTNSVVAWLPSFPVTNVLRDVHHLMFLRQSSAGKNRPY